MIYSDQRDNLGCYTTENKTEVFHDILITHNNLHDLLIPHNNLDDIEITHQNLHVLLISHNNIHNIK